MVDPLYFEFAARKSKKTKKILKLKPSTKKKA